MFITPDSIVPDWYDPQSLNRYAYCLNNPLKYIDSSGHEPVTLTVLSCIALTKIVALGVAWGGVQIASWGADKASRGGIGDTVTFGNAVISPVIEINRFMLKSALEFTKIDTAFDRLSYMTGRDFLGAGFNSQMEFELFPKISAFERTSSALFDSQVTKYNLMNIRNDRAISNISNFLYETPPVL